MKKLVIAMALMSTCVGAFAQGKIKFVNDDSSLVVLTTDTSKVLTADLSKVGTALGDQAGPLPSGISLVAGLYVGTSSGTMSLFTTVLLNSSTFPAGNIQGGNVTLAIPGIANNTAIGPNTPWFQVKVWDSNFASWEAGSTSYRGEGALFQMNPGTSITYVPTAPTSGNTTWTEGPIVVALIPEPTSLALLGLGAVSLMALRRRS